MKLRTSGEFRRVYASGTRYDGRLMTVFVVPNGLPEHRIGITASRKAIGNAVERNRTKRLLREVCRLSRSAIETLAVSYDVVLNARRSLLSVKVDTPLGEFGRIISKVSADEKIRGSVGLEEQR